MKIRCVAIDDEPWALELIRQYLSEFENWELVATFDDAIEGAQYLKDTTIDVLFVDIQMPDLTGLELVEGLNQKPIVIFTTAHKKFALEGFELNALDYLLKPIDIERFRRAINKAEEYFRFRNNQSQEAPAIIYVKSEYRLIKINTDDILYIEGLVDYVKIHLQSAFRPILTLITLKGILEQLPENRFSRIHRSYIVSNDKVRSIQNKKAILSNGMILPISTSHQDFILKWSGR